MLPTFPSFGREEAGHGYYLYKEAGHLQHYYSFSNAHVHQPVTRGGEVPLNVASGCQKRHAMQIDVLPFVESCVRRVRILGFVSRLQRGITLNNTFDKGIKECTLVTNLQHVSLY